MLEDRKEELLNRLMQDLLNDAKGDSNLARSACEEGLDEVRRLLKNHTKAV